MSLFTVKDLSFKYKNSNSEILSNVNLSISEYGVYGLLGRNGAGKTTFIKSCLNLLAYKGKIIYEGKDLSKITKWEIVDNIAALLEGNRNLYWKLTLKENIIFFSELRGHKIDQTSSNYREFLEKFSLEEKENVFIENLSRGMQQKVSIMCTLLFDTPFVFLDEPTLGLDYESKVHLIKLLKDENIIKNKIIFISSHDLNFIENVCNDIFLIKNNTICSYENFDKNIYEIHFSKFSTSKEVFHNLIDRFEINKYNFDEGFFSIDNNVISLSLIIKECEQRNIAIKSILNTAIKDFYLS